ncbi:HD-GYP domain-containing protein [Candidatus Viridilinea mediisalina]|uniref:Two-component system response regulator n=1 Tax=Candidatus Viridilinea mediisalina TaxID=2024553 RepID=A0A2A6RHQ7_9CHLR|nr:HD domain-containing phosphohydrolase [Candidatus Viridilinea mediisalina]PDW02552.1 two-component system response regulator [Candidatus Viridilinea mediisalina]
MKTPALVLIVDDQALGREVMASALEADGYALRFASNGAETIALAQSIIPDLILLDVMMPEMDGFETCRRLRADQRLALVPIVMVTALDDCDSRIQGLEAGADDFVAKPFHRAELRARVRTITRLNRFRTLLDERQLAAEELAHAYDATLEGWSRALDLRDHETEGHSRRVTELTVCLAEAMNLPAAEVAHIRRGALLHDIGKMGIPDAILRKPGPLNDEEWKIMRTHPSLAYELLSPINYLQPALAIPLFHHERWDGSGYPQGLAGETIPLAARIFAIVDVWDALTNDRPYRQASPSDEVLEYIRSQSGKHFDPEVVQVFLRLMSDGVIAQVMRSDGGYARRPTS